MTDKKDENTATPKIEDVKSALQELFGDSAEIEVLSVTDMEEEEMSRKDMIAKALATVNHEATDKLINEIADVFSESDKDISIIEFGVILSILCEIIAEVTEDVDAVEIAALVMSLTQATHVMKQKREAEKHTTH